MLAVRTATALTFVFVSGVSFAQTRTMSALMGEVLEYPTTGCNGAVVRTPLPGRQFTGPSLNVPDGANGFFEAAARMNARWITDLQCIPTGHTHVLDVDHVTTFQRPDGTIVNTIASRNWSGYQISNFAQYAQSGWTIPTVVRPLPPYATNYYSSAWTGIGGGFGTDISAPLIQAGSEQDYNVPGTPYYFWYQIYGGSANTLGAIKLENPGLVAHAGDSVGSVVIWQPSSNDPSVGPVTFGICNFSYSICVNVYLGRGAIGSKDPPSQKPGNSVEWIVEAPLVNGLQSYIADFDFVSFAGDCWAPVYQNGATCNTMNNSAPTPIDMYQYISGILRHMATAGSLATDGTFTDAYVYGQQ